MHPMSDHDRLLRLVGEVLELRTYVEQRLVALSEANVLQRAELVKRFEEVNEFRGALADAQSEMVGRREVGLMIEQLTGRVSALEQHASAVTGQAKAAERQSRQLSWLVAGLVGIAGVVIALIQVAGS